MKTLGLFVRLHARAGKEDELAALLQSAVHLAQAEPDTLTWYALKFDDHTFGIFDAFAHEAGRESHLNGPIAAALMAHADSLLAKEPVIEKVQLLASK